MKILLIDTGVNPALYPVSFERTLSVNKGRVCEAAPCKQKKNHGTVCGAIIASYASGAEITSLGIFKDGSLEATVEDLITAIVWGVRHGFKYIHLSLGTTQPNDWAKVRRCMGWVFKHDVMVVSAISNKHYYTYPSSFPTVIGVRTAQKLSGYAFLPVEEVKNDFEASASHKLLQVDGDFTCTYGASSYAAPVVTAYLANGGAIRRRSYDLPYFISEAVVLSPNKNALVSGCSFRTRSIKMKDCLKKASFLVVCGLSSQDTYQFVQANSPFVKAIVYCGVLEAPLKKSLEKNLLVWDEKSLFMPVEKCMVKHYPRSSTLANIVMVQFSGDEDDIKRVIYKYILYFRESGIACEAIGDLACGYLYGLRATLGLSLHDACVNVVENYDCELVFVCAENDGSVRPDYSFSITEVSAEMLERLIVQ